jgi:hypothetical protein
LQSTIKLILKLAFAAAIIGWLLKSGKLDFSLISQSITNGYNWLFCILILIVQDSVSGIRWRWLLKLNSQEDFPYSSMVRITWIGLFFNSFLPGAVTGDFIKLLYIKDLDPKMSKTYLVTSVLMDRILGLTGLLCIMGFSSLIFYSELAGISKEMEYLLHINLLLFSGAIALLSFLFAPMRLQQKMLNLSELIPVLGEKIHKTLSSVWIIGQYKRVLMKCLLLSVFLQTMNFAAFYIISSPFYSSEIPFQYIVTLIPIGFMFVAVPISPAGLGVGHVVFERLFSYVQIEGGASFFNLYFIALVFVNSFGFLPYIFGGKKHSLEEAGNLAEQN